MHLLLEEKEQYWQRALQFSPSGETHTVSWGKGNVTITNLFIAEKAAGTWSVYMTGTNADVLYAKYEYLSKCKQ